MRTRSTSGRAACAPTRKRGDREHAAKLDAEAAETPARLGLVALRHDLAAGDTAPRATVQVPPPPAPGPAQRTARLSHEGDVWTVACDGELTRLKDSKGLAYLLQLLQTGLFCAYQPDPTFPVEWEL